MRFCPSSCTVTIRNTRLTRVQLLLMPHLPGGKITDQTQLNRNVPGLTIILNCLPDSGIIHGNANETRKRLLQSAPTNSLATAYARVVSNQ